jgi:putative ABC transport system permease protein
VALLLVLLLDGVFAGAMQRVTAYIDRSPADVFVSQKDVTTMHMSFSALPPELVAEIEGREGVAWAEGLRYATALVEGGGESRLTYVFGYDTSTGRAGPRGFAEGGAPGPGQVVVDDVAADELGVGLGDEVEVFGTALVVSGLSTHGTNIVNTTVYVDHRQFEQFRGDQVSYVLVGAEPGTSAERLAQELSEAMPDVTVQTSRQFSAEEARIVGDMSTDVMAIMTVVALLIALAVVGLTLFTITLSKLREFGVIKALGATPARLGAVVVGQAVWSIAVGLAVALALALVLGRAITELTPNVLVVIEASSVVRVGALGLVVGALGSLIPLRRVLAVDPASAFRRL